METTQEFNVYAHDHKLKCFAYKLTRDQHKAEDLLQTTYLKALSKKHYFKGGDLNNWLYTIMYNSFINDVRREALYSNCSIDNMPERSTSAGADSPTLVNEIETTFNVLEPAFKRCVRLYMAGYKYKEIADKLNIPIGTVKSKIHFARNQFKTLYHDSTPDNKY